MLILTIPIDSSIDIRCSKSAYINENVTCNLFVNSERQFLTIAFKDGYRSEVTYTSSTKKVKIKVLFNNFHIS